MESPDHQPYKSRLFNFLNRQSSQWRNRTIRSVQYLRIGIEWSLQILIYPIYLIVQTGRVIPKQLRFSWTQKALRPGENGNFDYSSKVDKTLHKVFQETENCLSKSKIKKIKKNNLKTPILIQGIASKIEDKDLVLVSKDNTIIDIFSEIQQQHLKKYIRLEIANYLYNLKHNYKENLRLTHSFSKKNDHTLLPIRWFWQTMAWMQKGTLATNLNLFRESSLVPTVSKNVISSTLATSNVVQGNSIDNSLQLSSYFKEKLEFIRGHIRQKSNQSLNIDNEDPFRIEFLIYAAMDYFLNRFATHQQLTSNPDLKQLQFSIDSGNLDVGKLEDFDLSDDNMNEENWSSDTPLVFKSSRKFLRQSASSTDKIKKYIKTKTKKKNKHSNESVTDLQKTENNKHSVTPNYSESNQKVNKNSPHWIETEAKTTGYIKHPLVMVLEWLDSAIHWLEKLVSKLSNLFRQKH
ncbi:hypothetical protein [Crocosphaera sp. Alani8]|uniref:hypothetical protein n=1 Tax=Crocosphaera sp. Alani8 TaxID=3038952 RepID=UPI00313D1CFD